MARSATDERGVEREVAAMKVAFHPGPKDRHYTLDGKRSIDGLEVKSVTEILKEIGDKFGVAAWWGMKVGVEGVWKLGEACAGIEDPAEVIPLLTANKLTVNHVRDSAGDRGTNVHAVAEDWANGKGFWPSDHLEQGYVEAFASFIEENPIIPTKTEVRVGSLRYAYAGTYDLEAYTDDGFALFDYKTKTSPPKGTPKAYEQHHLQLAAYELARREMGKVPTTKQYVVNLYPDGSYALIENRATEEQWLDCLRAYRALTALKDSLRVRPRKVPA